MSKKLIVLGTLLIFATLSFAQAPSTRMPARRSLSAGDRHVQSATAGVAPVAPSTITCAASYASGSGERRTTDCVTVNGNVIEFSVNGEEMIQVGTFDEGYGICDFTTGTHYYDYGWTDSGNLLASSFTLPTAKSAVSTRFTSDGIFKITNTITQAFATATAPGKVTAKTAVKNNTGVSRTIFFLRHADLDANGDTFHNDFDWGVNSAFGIYNGTVAGDSTLHSYGLAMLDASYSGAGGTNQNFYTLNDCCSPDPCSPFVNISTQPFQGDGSLMGLFGIVIPAGGSKTFAVTYQPL